MVCCAPSNHVSARHVALTSLIARFPQVIKETHAWILHRRTDIWFSGLERLFVFLIESEPACRR